MGFGTFYNTCTIVHHRWVLLLTLPVFETHAVSPQQESMVIEVPRLKDIPTDVMPTLQDRLNVITDILSRISKLLSEDLDKAVSAVVGQDKNGNMSVGSTYTIYTLFPNLCSRVLKIGTVLQVLLRTRGQS